MGVTVDYVRHAPPLGRTIDGDRERVVSTRPRKEVTMNYHGARKNRERTAARGLRHFLLNQLSDTERCMPLDGVIRECYREVLRYAAKMRLSPSRLPQKLRDVAAEVIRRRREVGLERNPAAPGGRR